MRKEGTAMSNKNLPEMGEKQVKSLGKTAIGMLAVGVTSGLALIAAGKKIGDAILESEKKQKKSEHPEKTEK